MPYNKQATPETLKYSLQALLSLPKNAPIKDLCKYLLGRTDNNWPTGRNCKWATSQYKERKQYTNMPCCVRYIWKNC